MEKEIIEQFSYMIIGFFACAVLGILISLCGCTTTNETSEISKTTPIHYRLYYTINNESKTLDFEGNYISTSPTSDADYITTSDYDFNLKIKYNTNYCIILYKNSDRMEVIGYDFNILVVDDEE